MSVPETVDESVDELIERAGRWAFDKTIGDTAGSGVVKAFIPIARKAGLPVAMLSYVQQNYLILTTPVGGSYVDPFRDQLRLGPTPRTLIPKTLADGSNWMSEADAIGELYHEATHAYMDLKKTRPDVSQVIKKAKTYYKSGKLEGAVRLTDPERLAWEAAAMYAGHRVEVWWNALEALTFVRNGMATSPDMYTYLEGMTKKARTDYNKAMAQLAFGYQNIGDKQVRTTTKIPAFLSRFCDDALLENKIPDNFNATVKLRNMYVDLMWFLGKLRVLEGKMPEVKEHLRNWYQSVK